MNSRTFFSKRKNEIEICKRERKGLSFFLSKFSFSKVQNEMNEKARKRGKEDKTTRKKQNKIIKINEDLGS